MSGRRVLVLYGSLLLGFAVVLCRLFWLCSNTAYAARAEAQSTATLTFPARRGNFYDCNGHLLTGLGEQWLALSLPGEGSYTKLYPYASKAGQAMLYQKRNASRPFLVEVTRDVSAMGAWCYAVPRRYGDAPLASALLGYLDGEGHGVAGLEAALEDLLSGTGAQDKLVCAVNAQGKLRSGTEPELVKSDSGAVGVQLTLSRSIQRAAEAVAVQTMQSGCILVLDAASAKVRACASTPGFDPENVSASLNAPDSPLVNRAFQAYAVGSVFKPVLAAAALEAGKTGLVWDCPGYCVVDGQVFRCAGGVPHGAGAENGCPPRLWPDAEFGRHPEHGCRSAAGGGNTHIQRGFCQFLLWAGGAVGYTDPNCRHDEHHCGGRYLAGATLSGMHFG